MKTSLRKIFLIVLSISTIVCDNIKTIDDVILSVQTALTKTVDLGKQSFSTMCTGCDKCAWHMCSARIPDDTDCEHDFGTPTYCSHCQGQRLEKLDAYVSISNKYEKVNPASEIIRQSVCFSSKMVDSMVKIREEHKEYFRFLYFGTSSGIERSMPAAPYCPVKEHRWSPYYVTAASGVRNVAILIDSSSYTNKASIAFEKEYALRILNSLSFADKVVAINYSDFAVSSSPDFVSATAENLTKIRNFINSIEITPNYASIFNGLTKLYDILNTSKQNISLNFNADVHVILVSSGNYLKTNFDIANLVTTRQNSLALTKRIIYFTTSVGNSAVSSENILRQLACGYSGIYSYISDESSLNKSTDNYFQLLRIGVQNKQITWTEPYQDIYDLGTMMAAALPVWDETVTPNFLIGVVGINIQLSKAIQKVGGSDADYGNKVLQTTLQTNASLNLNNCQIDSLREYKCSAADTCSNANTTIKKSFEQCSTNFSKVWCEDENTFIIAQKLPEERSCCRCILKSSVALIAVGWVLFGISLFALILYRCCSGSSKNEDPQDYNTEERRMKDEDKQEVQA